MIDRPYRILIIEDNPEDRAVYLRRIAQGHEGDYRFWETGSGEDGLRMCREVRPDCILLDYQLPDLDGLEFLDRFRAEFAGDDVAIIMLTGHGNEAVAVQAMKKGVQDYLIKSLNSDSLGQAVRAVILKGIMRRKIEDQRRELESLSAERARLIAELERRTAALTEADRRKDEFLAMLAHELRNPLAPVRIGLQLMRQANGDRAIIDETCGMLERQVQHMVRLVDDLLDVSRVSRGKIHICKQRRDFATLVRGAVETCRPLIDERRHRLIVSMPTEPVWLEADPVRIEQVVANLLNNAAKYTPSGGTIDVGGHRDGDEVVLSVRDNGIGIARELLPHIFDMFTQADNSLARTQGGLGIGLTLVQLLVQLHGGSVQALSPGDGLGAEFVVRLPGIPGDTAPAEPPCPRPGRADGSFRVLVVDDNVDAAQSLARLLELSGHVVQTRFDGVGALEAAGTFGPQIVLLDIGMPGMDGYQVAERLRCGHSPDLLLVAITGYGREEDRRRSKAAGFDLHMVKPVDARALMVQLAERCTGSSDRRPA